MLIHARWLRAISLSLSLAFIISACGSRPADPTTPAITPAEAEPTTSGVTVDNGIDCRGAQPGATLSMIVPWSESDIDLFRSIVQPLIDNCGIELNINAMPDAATLNASLPLEQPDLLAWNQLGVLSDYADQLRDIRQLGAQTNNYPESLLNLEFADDQRLLVLPLRIDITSAIWYSPARFSALGYSVPNTPPELDALVAQMSADGNIAWSMGLEAGAQSGAAGVDFVQDVLLLLREPDYISDLIAGRIPYNDDALLEAYARYIGWTTNEASAVGAAAGALSTNVTSALDQVFSSAPQALMIKQSGFDRRTIAERFPKLEPGVDYDFFPFPGEHSLSGTFDFLFAFSDSPATRAMIHFLSDEQGATRMAESGFGLSPNLFANGHYSDPQLIRKAEMFANTPRVWPALRDALPSPFGAAQLRAHLDILQGSEVLNALTRATSAQKIARDLPLPLDCRGVQPGDTLSIIHPWSGAAEAHLMAVLQPLVDACGVRIEARVINERETLDEAIVAAPPDALFWPNLRLSRVYREQLQELGGLGANGQNYDSYWFNLGLLNGSFLALPVGVDIESLIWYKPAQFEANLYQVPTTFAELVSLVDRMVAEDRIPWSMGFEAGERTGTLGAHFAQDVILVHRGPDFLAGVASNDFQYSDDGVVEGYETFRSWASDEAHTVGGVLGTMETSGLDAIPSVLGNTPNAFMIRQTNLAARAITERRPAYRLGIDYDFFPFPGVQGLQGQTDFVSVFKATPATQLLITYLSSASGALVWAHDGYKLSPNRYARGAYTDPLLIRQSELLASAPGFTLPLDAWIPEPFGVAEAAAVVQIIQGVDIQQALADVTVVQEETLGPR